MRGGSRTLDWEHAVWAAAGDPDRWPDLLEDLHELHGARGAALLAIDDMSAARFSASLAPAMRAYLDEGIYAIDPRLALSPLLERKRSVLDTDHYSTRAMERMEYYQEWLPGHDLGPFVGLRAGTRERPAVLTLYRPAGERPFSERERGRLDLLSDTVVRAVALDRAIGATALDHRTHWHESTGAGVLGMNRDGTVAFASPGASKHLGPGTGIDVRHGSLHFADPADEARYLGLVREADAIIRRATLGIAGGATLPPRIHLRGRTDWDALAAAPGSMPAPGRAVALELHPITEGYRGFVPCAYLVVLSDPFANVAARDDAYIALWDLTVREAELVRHLVEGRLVAEAARAMQVREATARTYLKAIYRKTGTRAQSELVARAARL